MTGLFAFDGPMYCDINGVYCNTTITNEMLKRYFVVVDKLYLLIRTIHLDETYEKRHLRPLELHDNIEVVEMPNLNTPRNFLQRGRYASLIAEWVRKIDMFFLRIPSIISNMTAKECIKQGKPYLAEVGGCAWDSYWNHGIQGKIVAPSMFFNQRKTVKNAAFATYVTEKWLQNRYPSKGDSIVASNVYLNIFDDNNIDRRIHLDKNRTSNRYRIGTIASVDVRYKGQEYIVKAIGKLKQKGIILEYDLVGAGDPSFLSSLADKCGVASQINFLGVKLHDDIWTWLDTIDVYAQPSKQEGLPRAVIEAMNRGCMTIGSNVAGIPELLEEDMIFKSGNVEQICCILEKLIAESNHEKRIRRNFEKSRAFEVSILNERRNNIFKKYKSKILDNYEKRK